MEPAARDAATASTIDVGPRLRCRTTGEAPLVLSLEGSLSGDSVRRLHAALLELDPPQVQALTAGDVVLDLGAVDAVDLEALRLLVRLDQALGTRGHTLLLRNPTRTLLHVVAGAGLLDALPLAT